MSTLNLHDGDPDRADEIADAQARQAVAQSEREKRKAKRESQKKESGSSSTRSRAKASPATESGLQGRLVDAFTRLANMLERKGDEELSTAINDEKQAMAQGLVSLTRNVTPLRGPLVLLISFLEPVLAFWRVGSILGGRLIERRQRVMAERAMQEAGAQAVGPTVS